MYKLYVEDKNIKKDITNFDILNHINNISNIEKKEESKKAYLLLEYALRLEGIKDFKIDFSSKPKLLNEKIEFNISHDMGTVAVVLSLKPIGIDLMHIRKINKKIIDYIINDNEKYPTTDIEYTTLWCMKEAYIKYMGKSISSDLKLIDTTRCKYDIKTYDNYIIVICIGKK